jgi:hypothetical protein
MLRKHYWEVVDQADGGEVLGHPPRAGSLALNNDL